MECKKADNEILDKKKQINQIDNLIDHEKSKIKRIDSIQESVVSLTKNMNQCIDLLSVSIKGTMTESMLDDMRNSNKSFYINMATALDDETEMSNKKINKLSETKENILKETKNQEE